MKVIQAMGFSGHKGSKNLDASMIDAVLLQVSIDMHTAKRTHNTFNF